MSRFGRLVFRSLLLTLAIVAPAASYAGYDDFGFGGSSINLPIYVDINGTWGYAGVSGSSTSAGASLPKVMQWGAGVTLAGYFWNLFLFGVSSDYQFIGQYSVPDSTIGTFRGQRYSIISPTVGFKFSDFVIKADVEFLGDYNLLNTTSTGADVSYTGVLGFRGSVLYDLLWGFHVGVQYQSLSFSKVNNSALGLSTLSSPLKLWQVGVMGAYVF